MRLSSMRRYLPSAPKSLFGRNLLLLTMLVLVVEVAIFVVFQRMVQEPRMQRAVGFMQAHTAAVSAALKQMTPMQRSEYLSALNQNSHIKAIEGHLDIKFDEPRGWLLHTLFQRLEERLGHDYALGWQAQDSQYYLWIGTHISGHEYWLGFDSTAFVGRLGKFAIILSAAIGLVAFLGAYFIQRRINYPLRALANATVRLGQGSPEVLYIKNAPIEVAQVVDSFNQMSNNLKAMEHERVIMLAGVSHDLRTPLAKLRLATEILAEHGDKQIIESMVRNIAVADEIIGQFIDFSRLGSSEDIYLCEANELVRDVAFTAGQARITLELASGLPPLTCRPIALRRAVANLVENALRYSDGQVIVRTEVVADQLLISVADTGNGIPETEMERLKQPFTRLVSSRTGKPGAGLGLAIVEKIVKLHHGELALKNQPEKGLVAMISVPLEAQEVL